METRQNISISHWLDEVIQRERDAGRIREDTEEEKAADAAKKARERKQQAEEKAALDANLAALNSPAYRRLRREYDDGSYDCPWPALDEGW